MSGRSGNWRSDTGRRARISSAFRCDRTILRHAQAASDATLKDRRRPSIPSSDGCRRTPETSPQSGKSISTVSPGSCAPESKSNAGSNTRMLCVRVSLLSDPQPLAALERHVGRMEGLFVLRDRAHARRRRDRRARPRPPRARAAAAAPSLVSVPRKAMRSPRSRVVEREIAREVGRQCRPLDDAVGVMPHHVLERLRASRRACRARSGRSRAGPAS